MRQLVAFLYKYRGFFLFILLEVICAWMIVANHDYQRTVYLNTSSGISGSLLETSDNISDYFHLRKVNLELAAENARLQELLLKYNQQNPDPDSVSLFAHRPDTTDSITQYHYHLAEVVDNSILMTNNFLTIDKGSRDGIKPGMGIVNQQGVVGKVRSVSNRYAQVISLLNVNNQVSSKLKRNNRLGTIKWDGIDPKKAKLLHITRDVDVQVGDTVVTSSFNAIYPKDLMIGVVSNSQLDRNQRDLEIEVTLSVDFGSLTYVYVVENQFKAEKDSLINNNPLDFNE